MAPLRRSFCASVRPARFSGESAVAVLPSSDSTQPPAWVMKAPTRWNSGEITSPVWDPVVRRVATRSRPAQSFGTSASVRPALVQRSSLITRARVEKSLGAHWSLPSMVKVCRSEGT